jgi:anti-sigma factor RsiW
MSVPDHDRTLLGAYALGVLDQAEAQEVTAHLSTCADCRREVNELGQVRPLLDTVPPEAFLDGPPDNDMVLQRALREIRREAPARRRWAPAVIGLAAAVALAVAVGGGVLIGRQTAPTVAAAPAVPANARSGQVTDPATGASMKVTMVPKAGWVTVNATVAGVAAGTKCLLQVVPRTGDAQLAGSWKVSPQGAREGTTLQGSAIVDPTTVAAVRVVTTDGKTVVTVPV